MAAAGGTPVQDLCEEATCPICLDYFEDPVIITGCGHNFCRACLTQSWEKNRVNKAASCPQCRKPSRQSCLLPNRQLAACVEIAKKLREGEKGKVCETHRAPLTLFCKDEALSLCAMCEKSDQHRDHELVPLEEAAHKYKELIFSRLDILRKKREQILTQKADAEKESQDLFKSTETERQKMVAQFQEMHRFLEDQEKLFLDQMEEVKKEIAKKRDEHLARLSSKLTSLEGIIQEMEEQCHHQVASEFLQGVRSTLERSEERQISEDDPAAFSPELRWKIWNFCDVNSFLNGLMEPFKGNLLHGQQLRKADVSLDPETAHPQLILSGDRKSVKWGDELQDLPNNPERFDLRAFVLGREGFTQGRYFWEVLVGSEGTWAVGVARKSVRRKAPLTISPKEGIWAVAMSNGKYWSQQSPDVPLQTVSRKLTKIQVILNYAGERVAFFDADTGSLLYTFLTASFSGETLLPFFYPKKSHLSISP
ncbi:E3 ubiquitin-protein ligase TRIM7-like [Pogona vitticeps]